MELQLQGKIPSNFWKYLFVLTAICMGVKGGDLLELLV